jgi:hypothetical protein
MSAVVASSFMASAGVLRPLRAGDLRPWQGEEVPPKMGVYPFSWRTSRRCAMDRREAYRTDREARRSVTDDRPHAERYEDALLRYLYAAAYAEKRQDEDATHAAAVPPAGAETPSEAPPPRDVEPRSET